MSTLARLPTLFLSHGSPMLAVDDSPAGRFLDRLGATMPRPRAIVVASAHFVGERPLVGGASQPRTIHDFGGFPEPLYAIRYPAPGSPALAEDLVARLAHVGLPGKLLPGHGIDHGVWVPLLRMYPQADIPVVALSVNPLSDAAWHLDLGRALAGLRDEGVLVIGSGGFVHNLGDLDWRHPDAPLAPWASEFAEWMHENLAAGNRSGLLAWQSQAPNARKAHPTTEHLMPLFVALGAAGEESRVEVLHRSHQLGTLALDAFAFH